jgi:hypothetical protein
MGVIATADLTIDAPIGQAFSRFTDFSCWDLWFPPEMRPIRGPSRELQEGDRVIVALGKGRSSLRTELDVIRVRPNREICWRAGLPGLLIGEHSFFFREEGTKTALRSEEPFTGLLTFGPLASAVERSATEFGIKILASFAAHLAKPR